MYYHFGSVISGHPRGAGRVQGPGSSIFRKWGIQAGWPQAPHGETDFKKSKCGLRPSGQGPRVGPRGPGTKAGEAHPAQGW